MIRLDSYNRRWSPILTSFAQVKVKSLCLHPQNRSQSQDPHISRLAFESIMEYPIHISHAVYLIILGSIKWMLEFASLQAATWIFVGPGTRSIATPHCTPSLGRSHVQGGNLRRPAKDRQTSHRESCHKPSPHFRNISTPPRQSFCFYEKLDMLDMDVRV